MGHGGVLLDDVVEYVGHLARYALPMKRQANRGIAFTKRGQRGQQRSQFLRVRHSRVVQSLHTVFLQGWLNAARAVGQAAAQQNLRRTRVVDTSKNAVGRRSGMQSHARPKRERVNARRVTLARHPFLILVKPATGAPKSNERAHNPVRSLARCPPAWKMPYVTTRGAYANNDSITPCLHSRCAVRVRDHAYGCAVDQP